MANKQQGQQGSNEEKQGGRQSSAGREDKQEKQGGQHGSQGGGSRQSQQEDKGGGQQSGGGRGFAGMDPERQREIAAEGGRAAHASGNAHEFTSEEAREAGSHSHDRTNSRNQQG